MSDEPLDPKVSVGFASEAGPRARNEDFVGAVVGGRPPDERRDIVIAIADGIGGARGGRIAAETAVRGFLDGLWDTPETMEVRRAGAKVLNALNGWLHAQGQYDAGLAGMGCTFTAVVMRGRVAHVLHVGDTRAYRLNGERLTRLSVDHVREVPGRPPMLYRALGVEAELRLDYAAYPVALYDRFLLCSDGVHRTLPDEAIAGVLTARAAPAEASRALVDTALAAGSDDNCTALVLDVVGVPTARSEDIVRNLMELPLLPVPRAGETIDGFVLEAPISEGPYSRLFAGLDRIDGGAVALKFPKPPVGEVIARHAAFAREAWVGARVHSPWLVNTIDLPPGRQTRLYVVMPLYRGELLETRLARRPAIGLEEGRSIAVKLAHALAALHRAGVIHRDIKPDNVMLEPGGSLKLLDLGVVRLPGLEDDQPPEIPGTAAYMAPEMFAGEAGCEATDIYALGVTLFRAFTGEYPYGNLDATSRPRQDRPKELTGVRPDLPAWLQEVIGRAMALDPADRFPDVAEFAEEMEGGPAVAVRSAVSAPTLYQRYPLRFWQAFCAILALALAAALWWRGQ